MSVDLSANGIARDWRIGVGDMASEHFALQFRATRLGAIRRFNAMTRTQPDLDVTLHFVTESGAKAGKAYRFAPAKETV